MIIELFGPPAAGKTTFARSLATRLRDDGHTVELILSYRPAENGEDVAHTTVSPKLAVINRFTRPAIEWLAATRHLAGMGSDTDIASTLLNIIPPRSLLWSGRLRQYIRRLEISWARAARSRDVVIIDQGFVQAVCSLVLLGRAPSRSLAEQLLSAIPRADLLIRLDAPRDVLRARLEARRRGQSWMENLLELSTPANLSSVEIIEMLTGLLNQQGRQVVSIDPGNGAAPRSMMDAIECDVMTAGMVGAHA